MIDKLKKILHALSVAAVAYAVAISIVSTAAYAQASLPATADMSVTDAVIELAKLLGTAKGAGAIGIALAIVQGLMIALRTPLANKLGKWKLVVLLGLSCIMSLLAAKLAGASWLASFVSGPVLACAQNFAHQLITHFAEKPDAPPPAQA